MLIKSFLRSLCLITADYLVLKLRNGSRRQNSSCGNHRPWLHRWFHRTRCPFCPHQCTFKEIVLGFNPLFTPNHISKTHRSLPWNHPDPAGQPSWGEAPSLHLVSMGVWGICSSRGNCSSPHWLPSPSCSDNCSLHRQHPLALQHHRLVSLICI